jgi:hypothetical protein
MSFLMPESPAPSRFTVLRDKLLHRFGKGGTLLLAIMVMMLAGAVIYAIEAEKPWGRTVQKRLEKHQALQPKEHAIIGLWWAAVVNAGVLGVLIGTAGWWMPGKTANHNSQIKNEETSTGKAASAGNGQGSTVHDDGAVTMKRWLWVLVLGAVMFGAWERWPKLWQSYWNDEAYSLERFAHGAWEEQKDGTVTFEPVTWTATLFENRNGNNHLLNSLTSRLSLDVWRAVTGAPREAFSEAATRMPQYLAALATILVVFLLGCEIGSPLVGAGAAWLMAVHPWHVRYGVEARGYSFMILFVGVTLVGLVRALRTNKLRWWLLFGASEALFLLSFPGALYVALLVNVVCVVELLRQRAWTMTGRLVAFNALASVPVLQWVLPSVPQILAWLNEHLPEYVTDVWQWLQDLGSVMVVGWQYDNPLRESHVGTDWKGVTSRFPLPPAVEVGLFVVLILAGIALAWRRGPAARLIVVAPVLAAVVSLAMNLRPGNPMTVWYLIYLLIPLTLAMLLPLEAIGRMTKLRWLAPALCAGFVYFYDMGTHTAVAALREHDRQPTRQTVAFIRAQSPDAITATFGVSDRQHSAYDARVKVLESTSDIDACVARSRAGAKPLYVYYCSDQFGQRRRPEIYERVVRSGEFEKAAEFPGSEELFSYRVYRLKPAP